jgi:diguanylate cyclase (GGDEF)-like protein
MPINSIRTLLIEDNPADAKLIQEVLAESPGAAFELEWVDGLAKGLQKLNSEPVDLVLLDLHLPESRGLDTFFTTHACAPAVPIVVLTCLDDRELALKAVRNGAQDYLVKGQIDRRTLVRSMQFALVRHRMQIQQENPSWKDDLTKLLNRQGFLVLGEQLLRLADTSRDKLTLFYVGLDGWERVDEVQGRELGDAALQTIAAALRETFHDSEFVARVGEHQFAFMSYSSFAQAQPDTKDSFVAALQAHSHRRQWPDPLTVSWGVSVYDPAKPVELATLMQRAEAQARLVFPH